MLHIHNGDCSAEIAKRSTLTGEHFAWREAMIDGPAPANLNGDDWRRLRARHLSEFYGGDPVEIESQLQAQEEKLTTFTDHNEVILWFESDLFCQTNLLYLLNWFAQRDPGETKLSLVCIGEFSGVPNFRGLGELTPEQMASLFPNRLEISTTELKLAIKAWQAYGSSDPLGIVALLETDTSALPFLQQALRLHLERFPSVRNGLNRIQNRGLDFIHSGLHRFIDLFPKFSEAEPLYGLGDAQFWMTLSQMSDTREPLLKMKPGSDVTKKLTPETARESTFAITGTGAEVLKGQADFVEINGMDNWLGGVHLSGTTALWRWNEHSQTLVFT